MSKPTTDVAPDTAVAKATDKATAKFVLSPVRSSLGRSASHVSAADEQMLVSNLEDGQTKSKPVSAVTASPRRNDLSMQSGRSGMSFMTLFFCPVHRCTCTRFKCPDCLYRTEDKRYMIQHLQHHVCMAFLSVSPLDVNIVFYRSKEEPLHAPFARLFHFLTRAC